MKFKVTKGRFFDSKSVNPVIYIHPKNTHQIEKFIVDNFSLNNLL